jgi:hypothetical protein
MNQLQLHYFAKKLKIGCVKDRASRLLGFNGARCFSPVCPNYWLWGKCAGAMHQHIGRLFGIQFAPVIIDGGVRQMPKWLSGGCACSTLVLGGWYKCTMSGGITRQQAGCPNPNHPIPVEPRSHTLPGVNEHDLRASHLSFAPFACPTGLLSGPTGLLFPVGRKRGGREGVKR